MEIDLTQLDTEGVRVRESYSAADLAGSDGAAGADQTAPVRADLTAWIRREGVYVRASGEFDAELKAECDRCLKPMTVPVRGEFDQRYSWGPVPAGGDEHEIDPADLDIERLEGHVLDTRTVAREQVELLAPIRIVCSEDCKGLCAVCGADLNLGDCACEIDQTDPRWDALRQFKK